MPAGFAIVLSVGFCGLFTALAMLIGPKATNPEKLKPPPLQQVDGKEIRAARHPITTIIRHPASIGQS